MRSGVSWLFALAGAALANGLSLEKRDAPAVFAVPFRHDRAVLNQLTKRSKTTDIATDFKVSDVLAFVLHWLTTSFSGIPST